MKLLLAEDEKEFANALVAVFKHNNYSVDVVYKWTRCFGLGFKYRL